MAAADSSTSVTAEWTFEHERKVAKPEVMYITGALAADKADRFKHDYPFADPTQSAPSEDPSTLTQGTCFCGHVKLELPHAAEPLLSVICHCRDCQEWHMAGGVPMMLFLSGEPEADGKLQIPVKITSGASSLSYVHRTPHARRFFTTCCGSRLFVTDANPDFRMCAVFPAVFPGIEWKPSMQIHARESNVLEFDVVAWNDLPAEYGGTGTKRE